MTMVTAVTLLPALLGFTGHNIDRLRLPYLGRTSTRSPIAERWARTIQRRPVLGLVAGAVVMVVLAAPALSMRLSFEDSSTAPHSTMAYTAHDMLARGFGAGYDAPLVVVAELTPGTSGLGPVADAVGATAGVASVTAPRTARLRCSSPSRPLARRTRPPRPWCTTCGTRSSRPPSPVATCGSTWAAPTPAPSTSPTP
jgi:RND superfamily putative drug exporter